MPLTAIKPPWSLAATSRRSPYRKTVTIQSHQRIVIPGLGLLGLQSVRRKPCLHIGGENLIVASHCDLDRVKNRAVLTCDWHSLSVVHVGEDASHDII